MDGAACDSLAHMRAYLEQLRALQQDGLLDDGEVRAMRADAWVPTGGPPPHNATRVPVTNYKYYIMNNIYMNNILYMHSVSLRRTA